MNRISAMKLWDWSPESTMPRWGSQELWSILWMRLIWPVWADTQLVPYKKPIFGWSSSANVSEPLDISSYLPNFMQKEIILWNSRKTVEAAMSDFHNSSNDYLTNPRHRTSNLPENSAIWVMVWVMQNVDDSLKHHVFQSLFLDKIEKFSELIRNWDLIPNSLKSNPNRQSFIDIQLEWLNLFKDKLVWVFQSAVLVKFPQEFKTPA